MVKKKRSNKKNTDWSDKKHVKALIEQRKFMWSEEYVELLAGLIGLKSGQSIADIGCGLGYLGHTYGKYIKAKGQYFGIDSNDNLLQMAVKATKKQKDDPTLRFISGSAMELPIKEKSVDVTMCQTLLMHLKEPDIAVKEMKRITKEGGTIVAFEPDWIWPASRSTNFDEFTFQDQLDNIDLQYHILKGRKQLGEGDFKIGPNVAEIFKRNGLKRIKVRLSDKVDFALIPPYSAPDTKHATSRMLDGFKNIVSQKSDEKRKEYLACKKYYIAGGGDAEQYKKLQNKTTKWVKRHSEKYSTLVKNKKLHDVSTSLMYVTIGEK